VKIFDSQDKLVAAIVGDVPQDIDDSSIMATVDGEEKAIYLPPDEDYHVEIFTRDDGTMSYLVSEEDFGGGSSARVVVYKQLDIRKGEVYRANVPAYSENDYDIASEGTKIDYRLTDTLGAVIEPTADVTDVNKVKFAVKVSSNKEPYGTAIGNKKALMGQYATVIALSSDVAKFEGWYENGAKIAGADAVYTFRALEDRDLEARFTLTILLGDCNADKKVDDLDVTHLARSLSNWDGYSVDPIIADVDRDGEVTITDVTYLARYLMKWPGYELD
jgi:hypothetical protein